VTPGALCAGRVAVVTGAGRGLGRAHALELARNGARVVVADLGAELDGTGGSSVPAERVAAEIRTAGGEAVAVRADAAEDTDAARLTETALDAWGRLDVLVSNAGIVRDRMLVSMTEEEWDAAVRVHLTGHFLPLRHAAAYWRSRAKGGAPVDARVVHTTSGAGLLGSVGQANYAAAKAGIAALTLVAAAELSRYGVTVNAIAPSARTRMTEEVFADMMARPESGFDAMDPANVSPLVAWLASPESSHVTGRVFEIEGGTISVATGWRHGPRRDKPTRWEPGELGPVIADLLTEAPEPEPVYGAARSPR
jgi:NAD(P)-dependent dehydrogenase (short-subunit alcohol dehydrogenase family)